MFGRGVVRTGDGFGLTPGGAARVRAASDYVAKHRGGERFRVVFSGGWPEASTGEAPPPVGAREGDLMLRAAHAAGLGEHADLYAETRSRSTLENLLHTKEDGLLSGYAFDARTPLGLVTHDWHLPRVRFLAGRVLGLTGAALLDVPAYGGEVHDDRGALLLARLGFLGVRADRLLHRERGMVAAGQLARRVINGRPGYRRRTVEQQ
ncbi:YdcF family protein [Actinoplanes sp. NPDC020271]|uniref:YdcF family protein n=1 Tax=Actinoplanes sp. NPDC020271 TaxID=3363896 RepID=UPI0037B2AC8D